MSRLLNEKKAVPLLTRLLLGLALSLFMPFAGAQNNLGELLDAGAKKISPDEFREDVVQRTIVGSTSSGVRMELMYASTGVIQGRSDINPSTGGGTGGMNVISPIDGVWTVDDSGRICASIVIGRTFLPFRCEYWFKYKDDYFLALSDSDPKAKLLRRTVKQ